jgi:selenocysteine lyase/cysteine desulfurase
MPLAQRLIDALLMIPGVRIHGITKARDLLQRVPTVSFTHPRHKPTSLARSLAEQGINVWSGSNYAIEVLRHLGLDENEGMLRVGLAHYNTQAEVDRIIVSLSKLLA